MVLGKSARISSFTDIACFMSKYFYIIHMKKFKPEILVKYFVKSKFLNHFFPAHAA